MAYDVIVMPLFFSLLMPVWYYFGTTVKSEGNITEIKSCVIKSSGSNTTKRNIIVKFRGKLTCDELCHPLLP